MDIVSDTKPELFYFLFGEPEAAFSFFTLFMPDLYLAKQQPCKVLLWQIVGWRSSVQMYRRRFLLRADFQRQQGFQFCLLVMLQPMLGALLESANPFAQSHHSSYCALGSLMKLYEAYIVWLTSFLHFFPFIHPAIQPIPTVCPSSCRYLCGLCASPKKIDPLSVVTGVTCIQAPFDISYEILHIWQQSSTCEIPTWILLYPFCQPRFAWRCSELHFTPAPKPCGLETRTPRFGTDLCDLRSEHCGALALWIRGCCHAEPFCGSCISKEVWSSDF